MAKNTKYRVVHTGLGEWRENAIVTEGDLTDAGADLVRLTNLGAIERYRELMPEEPDADQISATGTGTTETTTTANNPATKDAAQAAGKPAGDVAPSPLDGMAESTLRQMAAGYEIPDAAKKSKAELIPLILAAQQAKGGDEKEG